MGVLELYDVASKWNIFKINNKNQKFLLKKGLINYCNVIVRSPGTNNRKAVSRVDDFIFFLKSVLRNQINFIAKKEMCNSRAKNVLYMFLSINKKGGILLEPDRSLTGSNLKLIITKFISMSKFTVGLKCLVVLNGETERHIFVPCNISYKKISFLKGLIIMIVQKNKMYVVSKNKTLTTIKAKIQSSISTYIAKSA